MSEETPRRANRSVGRGAHRMVVDADSSVASTSSSLSSSVSASVWSLLQACRSGAFRTRGSILTGGAKRAGTSFRVSLRPSSYRQRHNLSNIAEEHASYGGVSGHINKCISGACDPAYITSPPFVRRVTLALILSFLCATLYVMLDPLGNSSSSYHGFKKKHNGDGISALHDSLSIEDRIAQNEMSVGSEAEVLSNSSMGKSTSSGRMETYNWDKELSPHLVTPIERIRSRKGEGAGTDFDSSAGKQAEQKENPESGK